MHCWWVVAAVLLVSVRGNPTCRDATVRYYDPWTAQWKEEPWKKWTLFNGYENCSSMAGNQDDIMEMAVNIAPQLVSTFQKMQVVTTGHITFSKLAPFLGGLGTALMGLAAAVAGQNRCNHQESNNLVQLVHLDPFNHTGQREMSAGEACCACGAGRDPDPLVKAVLNEFYVALNGKEWGNNLNWNTSAHYCLWDHVLCNSEAQVYSLFFVLCPDAPFPLCPLRGV